MSLENLSNRELIDNIYDSAGEHLRNTVTDSTNYKLWRKTVNELDIKQRVIYLIIVLNQQVMDGGFIQYFDNRYGMFGYETLRVLRTVGAIQSANLLEQALRIVNREQLPEPAFSEYIANNIMEDELGDELNELDDKYYKLDHTEDLEEILATWIKMNPISL